MNHETTLGQRLAAVPVPPSQVDIARAQLEGRRHIHRRRYLAGAAVVLAGGVLAAVPVTMGTAFRGADPAGSGTTQAGTHAPAMTLAGYRKAIESALDKATAVTHSVSTDRSPRGVETTQMWNYTAPDHSWMFRIQTRDESGKLIQDMAVRTTYTGAQTGTQENITYIAAVNEYATWTVQLKPNPKKPKVPTAGPSRSAAEWLKADLANHTLTLLGKTQLNGKPAILLGYTEGSPSDRDFKRGKLWIDPTTFLAMQDTVSMGSTSTTITYDYLSPTTTNLAQLWITPQPGWKKVPSQDLPRNLVH